MKKGRGAARYCDEEHGSIRDTAVSGYGEYAP